MRLLAPLSVLLAGCTLSGFEAEIQGRVPFTPPQVYSPWWTDTSTCDIIIVRGYEDNSKVVRHEMLHDLLRGDASHTDARWASCELVFG